MVDRHLETETLLVRGGLDRSPFGETAEAIYLTSGFVYDSAEAAEARFKGEEPGYIYSRYGNPTVRMFEQRLAQLEGAWTPFQPHRALRLLYPDPWRGAA